MGTEETPKYSKKELERMSDERHRTDHILLRTGANYEGNVLTPSQAQKDLIQETYGPPLPAEQEINLEPTTDIVPRHRQLGQFVLMPPNSDYHELSLPQAEINKANGNREALFETSELMMQPYETYYANMVPAKGQPTPGRKIRGGVIESPDVIDILPVDNIDIVFRTHFTYKLGKARHTLQTVGISADPREDKSIAPEWEARPFLHMTFSDSGNMETLRLKYVLQEELSNALFRNEVTDGHSVGDFVDDVEPQWKEGAVQNQASLDIQVSLKDTPTIEVRSRDHRQDGSSAVCEYRYDAGRNMFVRFNSTDGVDRPEAISTDTYFDLLEGMLSMVPATKAPY